VRVKIIRNVYPIPKGDGRDLTIRESLEQMEEEYLSPYAALSRNTKGRDRPEELCDIRPEYQRDRDKILHSKAFALMPRLIFCDRFAL